MRYIAFGAFIGSAAIAYNLSNENFRKGIQRQTYFWFKMLPVYYHYRAVELYLKMNKILVPDRFTYYEPLHESYAPKALEVIHRLRGFYIKIGQVASCRADILPPQYLKQMSTLQSDLPPTPWNTIEDIIIKELGKPIHEIFISIDKSPIGAASIGQVHRAVLLDGTPVVVKVMYPEVEDMFKVSYHSIPSFYLSPYIYFNTHN